MTTRDALTAAMNRKVGVRIDGPRLLTAYSFGLLLALAVLVGGCGPGDGNSHPQRAPGASVQEHWAKLEQIEDQLERTVAMAEFVKTLRPSDSDALKKLVDGGIRGQRSIDHLILMNAWSRVDPERAVARAMASSSPAGVAARKDVILEWASRDPSAAAAHADVDNAEIRRALVQGWYASGEPGLEDFVFSAGTSQAGQHFIGSYATELAHDKGAKGVADWIDRIREREDIDPSIVLHVHRKGLVAMAVADPEAAIAYCDIHCNEPYAESARPRLADRLGWLGLGDRAIAWIEASEDANTEEQRLAGRGAYRHWFKADRAAALRWAEQARATHANEAWFEGIARFVLGVMTRMDPEKALDWVPLLPASRERVDAMISIGRRWRELDEKAAEAWLESSPLSEAARARARTPIKYRNTRPRPEPDSDS